MSVDVIAKLKTKETSLGQWFALVVVVVSLVGESTSTALGEGANTSAPSAIAECNVTTPPAQPTMPRGATNVLRYAPVMPTLDPRSEYYPVSSSKFARKPQDDRDRARVRLLLTGPLLEEIIDVFVFVDGRPFPAVREQWIDGLLEAAKTDRAKPAEKTQEPAPVASEQKVEAQAARFREQSGLRSRPTLRNRVNFYLAAAGQPVERDEIVALLEQWSTGHDLLLLGPGPTWRRAESIPLVTLLDVNGDGSLSADETQSAVERMRSVDVNEDGVVEIGELERAPQNRPNPRQRPTRPLIVPLDALVEGQTVALEKGTLDDARCEAIKTAPANIVLEVNFQSDRAMPSRVRLVKLDSAKDKPAPQVSTEDAVITVDYGAEYVEFSAIQASPEGKSGDQPEQIAIGAAVDGYPLTRLLDRDNNQRISEREGRQLPGLLRELDRDRDGVVAANEIPVALRFSVSRGALLHESLAKPTSASKGKAESPSKDVPEWFASMDANRDGDLTREEFSGTNEQFKSLDQDQDGLVSAAEAANKEE